MRREEFVKGCFRIVADEGKVIQSKAMHYDEESDQEVADVIGEIIYLGKNDSKENYIEGEKEEEF